jgi:hypothetical protein
MITGTVVILTLIIAGIIFVIKKIFNIKTRKAKATMEKQEQLTLTFVKGRDGKVIARTQKGKICLLDIPYCKENHIFVNENEDWRCAVKIEKEKVIIIQPITRTVTAQENAEIYGEKAKELVSKFGKSGTKEKSGQAKTSKRL